ncbi:flavin reductase family protein [Pseudonocardia alni]|uniref:flavin reductase family protein n=1 Tax=Pseudonocardia alni TaxID=33907 RepID=UPI00332BF62E
MRVRSDTATDLRAVFAAFPTRVVAVCGLPDGAPVGMTVSTFTPVSLDPPLLSLCIQRSSTTWPQLRRSPALGVTVLGEDHEHAALQLSSRSADRFAGTEVHATGSGAVVLPRSCAWFDCTLRTEHPAGDHLIAVLHIDDRGTSDEVRPLVVHASRFRRLAPPTSRPQES